MCQSADINISNATWLELSYAGLTNIIKTTHDFGPISYRLLLFCLGTLQGRWYKSLRESTEKGNKDTASTETSYLSWSFESMQFNDTTLQTDKRRHDRKQITSWKYHSAVAQQHQLYWCRTHIKLEAMIVAFRNFVQILFHQQGRRCVE